MTRGNVVLVTVDSLRTTEVDYLTDDGELTPTIASLAEDATIADTAITPSTHTRASVPAILSSRYSHNFFDDFFGQTDIPHLGKILSTEGYETAAFHSNPLLSSYFGYDDGFETFYDAMANRSLPSERLTRVYSKIKRLLRRHPYEPADALTDRALSWLETASEPYFLWIHYMDPHGPYTLDRSRGYLDKFRSERLWYGAVRNPTAITPDEQARLRAGYRDDIAFTDAELRRLVDALDDQTMLSLVGDHGEEFREHGGFTHQKKLYDELVRVPFLFDAPTDDVVVDGPYSALDIVPTICSLVDVDPPAEFVGEDLLDTDGERREYVFTETNTRPDVTLGVRTNRHKLIARGDHREFYDLAEDPGEQDDIADRSPDQMESLEAVLTEFTSTHDIAYSGGDEAYGDIDAHTEDLLHDLGYVD